MNELASALTVKSRQTLPDTTSAEKKIIALVIDWFINEID
jgi:hypothetical protein